MILHDNNGSESASMERNVAWGITSVAAVSVLCDIRDLYAVG